MEEIGCHFKFEKLYGNHYHDTSLLLSSGRNCLRYIIKERKIKTLFLPYFLCESLSEVAELENINIIYYHIDETFLPINLSDFKLDDSSYLYLVNYYGLIEEEIKKIIKECKYVIVDNTHDFYDKSDYNADVIYNYRKYFGVPDGACIVGNNLSINNNYSVGKSLDKIIEVVSRDETGEFFHYPTFYDADKYFQNEDLRYMSNFTSNYLNAIDYKKILKIRLGNYRILLENLAKYNRLNLETKELNFMYPLFVSDGEQLRKYLKENNIYSVKLWANVAWNGSNEKEQDFSNNMVLLPIDQRYSDKEMYYIINKVDEYYSKYRTRIFL